MPIIQKIKPNVVAQNIIGVQPMAGTAGAIFSMDPTEYNKYIEVTFSRSEYSGWIVHINSHTMTNDVVAWIIDSNAEQFYDMTISDDIGVSFYTCDDNLLLITKLKWDNVQLM